MAQLNIVLPSASTGMQANINVVMPDRVRPGEKLQALYLLHGLSDNETNWLRMAPIERYAEPYRLAVVMPCGNRTFYTNHSPCERYLDYVSLELPELMESLLPISPRRADKFIAGLSMGGYGALKAALTHPGKFSHAASFSGCTNVARRLKESFPDALKAYFGTLSKLKNSPDDLFFLLGDAIARVGGPRKLPKIFQSCGTEDFLIDDNRQFHELAERLGAAVRYSEHPGAHTWEFWDARLKDTLEWLPLKR